MTTTHHCPHCICWPDAADPGMGLVNRDAPFYPLVELVDACSLVKLRGTNAKADD